MESNQSNSRRKFLGTVGATVALSGLASPILGNSVSYQRVKSVGDPEEWFKKIKGKHRMVFDATRPHGVFPFAWPKVFLMTNVATGTPEMQNSVVVVLRHDAIPYAMKNELWEKYSFGDVFHAHHPMTEQPVNYNPFWQPKPGTFVVPGIGEVAIGINQLQESGVMFCVCDAAMTVYSAVVGQNLNQDPAKIKEEWVAGLLPDIQVVPSGVWALGRAQEHGCGYIFAG